MLMNGIVLAISMSDTLSPLGIYFRPFANCVRDTYTINNVVLQSGQQRDMKGCDT
jgi:hypothetical protein